jgi:hypothetical protein
MEEGRIAGGEGASRGIGPVYGLRQDQKATPHTRRDAAEEARYGHARPAIGDAEIFRDYPTFVFKSFVFGEGETP